MPVRGGDSHAGNHVLQRHAERLRVARLSQASVQSLRSIRHGLPVKERLRDPRSHFPPQRDGDLVRDA
jgi:hypothetical protein